MSGPASHPLRRGLLAAAGGALLFTLARAQSTTDEVKAAKAEEPISLSEFAVKADSNKGYIASESVTGSRVATAIKDLPFAVNVITSEFLDDFGSFDLSDGLGYTSSVTALDNGGNNTIRGYTSQYMLRDGFWRLGMNDKISVDRIEIIKGPSAAIYGAGPAGRHGQCDHQAAQENQDGAGAGLRDDGQL
jgi:iron complex outermembrane receptor protein